MEFGSSCSEFESSNSASPMRGDISPMPDSEQRICLLEENGFDGSVICEKEMEDMR